MSGDGTPSPPPDLPSLTAEQRRPLEVRGASVALSAGAGCGKTTVLTRRFLGALDDGVEALRTIVAVTFTEKAARELRQRIREACHARLRDDDDPNGNWLAILRGLEAAPVCTFHEFCAGVLRRHALAALIDPDFQIFDATIAASLRDQAVGRFLRDQLAARDGDLIELAVEYGLEQVREAIAALISNRDADRIAEWAERSDEEILDRWRAAVSERLLPLRRGAVLDAAKVCGAFWLAESFDHKSLARKRLELLDTLRDLPERIADGEWLQSLHELAKLPGGVRAEHWPSLETKERAGATQKSLREAIKSAIELIDETTKNEATSRRGACLGGMFARLGAKARAAFQDAKRARGGLDFDDLLLKTRDLLRDDPDVRDAENRAVRFVLVDEFQDTDPVQSEILKLLTGDGFADGGLFVVGDFKQSIYRFRGARPRLFHEYRRAFPEPGRLELTENFRSAPGVIDFVNALFHEAFAEENGRLIPGAGFPDTSDRPAVTFVWPAESEDEPDDGAGPARKKPRPKADELREVEARWLARLIRARLDEGWPILDRKTRTARDAHAGDVAMLFRSMTDLAAYEQALAAEGLDYHVVGGSSFYAQDEVRDLINVLSVIEDPFNGIALAGALRSPFFGLSDDAIFWLGVRDRGELAARFLDADALADLPATDRLRAERARDLLDRWRSQKDHGPMGELVDRVLEDSGYEAALLGEPLGDRKRANARKLARMAREFDARGGFTLSQFVARLRADLLDPPKEEQAATTDEEGRSVRLMSIHQSKGLEFPIVFVPDLNRSGPPRMGIVAFDPELGPLARLSDDDEERAGTSKTVKSWGRMAHEAVERAEEDDEAIRLLYVATTRARDGLVLSAGGGPDVSPRSPALRRLAACFDRGTGACLSALPDAWPVPRVEVVAACPASRRATPRARRSGPRSIAMVIKSAAAGPPPPSKSRTTRPRLVELDALRAPPPRLARRARLLRAVLADPLATQPGGLVEAAQRAARRQAPALSPADAEEVVRWLERPLAGLLDHATAIEPGEPWTIAWPPMETNPTVVLGWSDLIVRDDQGTWGIVTVSPPGSSERVERLRWSLSVEAEAARGRSPLGPGWRIILGDAPRFIIEDLPDPRAIDESLRAALAENQVAP